MGTQKGLIMAKYRKKPVIVEAQQFHAMQWPDCPEGVEKRTADETVFGETTGRGCEWFVLKALGEINICDGDWVIIDAKGKKRVCPANIFEQNYKKIED